ncbi:unnamed protein product [Pleuronectes platessa]|uniref:Uncharacterized protein n=1 Tax=Pleuronectes platessa TaxID=8262 RepID=A0A9N7TRU5_PLEPL|nr:unnamed protein product [Pleuronectes platessa]
MCLSWQGVTEPACSSHRKAAPESFFHPHKQRTGSDSRSPETHMEPWPLTRTGGTVRFCRGDEPSALLSITDTSRRCSRVSSSCVERGAANDSLVPPPPPSLLLYPHHTTLTSPHCSLQHQTPPVRHHDPSLSSPKGLLLSEVFP